MRPEDPRHRYTEVCFGYSITQLKVLIAPLRFERAPSGGSGAAKGNMSTPLQWSEWQESDVQDASAASIQNALIADAWA